jgi:hypothetical protein
MRQDQHDINTGDHAANDIPPHIDWLAIEQAQPRGEEK